MSAMFKKSNSKLSLAIIVSIVLHVILIIILCYKVMQDDSNSYGDINGQSLNAIMVDPSIMVEQRQRQSQSQINQQRLREQIDDQINKQTEALQQKQLEQQQLLKKLEMERLKLDEKMKQDQLEAERLEAERKKQEQLEADRKKEAERIEAERKKQEQLEAERKKEAERIEAERKKQEQLEAERKKEAERIEAEKKKQEQLEAERKKEAERLEAEKKAAQEKAKKEKQLAKQRAEAAKNEKAVNDLLGGLTSGKPNSSNSPASSKGNSNEAKDKFINSVRTAISNKFINPNKLYAGKSCNLEILIAPDGLILSLKVLGGDEPLCREAVAAAKLAHMPIPSQELYNEVKLMKINYTPN